MITRATIATIAPVERCILRESIETSAGGSEGEVDVQTIYSLVAADFGDCHLKAD